MTRIKICGLSRAEDIAAVNEAKPDYVGFVFYPPSRRYVSKERAAALIQGLKKGILPVGVFVNAAPGEIAAIAEEAGLYAAQLHGDETREDALTLRRRMPSLKIWKAARVRSAADIEAADGFGADLLVLDSFHKGEYGGTGKVFDWTLLKEHRPVTPFLLAGGIDETNLKIAVNAVCPLGIDLSGGVETDGKKDKGKILRAVALAHAK